MNYKTKEMYITDNKKRIYGEIYIPEMMNSPLLIISHGLGGSHQGSKDIAESVVKNGTAVFIYDFCGGGNDSKSSGKTTDMSVLTEAEDLELVIDELKKIENVKKNKIYLLGKSQGAYVSTIVASRRPDEIKCLIGLYPGYFLSDKAREVKEGYDKLPSSLDFLNLTVSDRYIEDLIATDIFNLMKDYNGSVLLIHGTADSIAPIGYAKKAASIFSNAEFISIDGAEHGFHGPERQKVIKQIVDFINYNNDNNCAYK